MIETKLIMAKLRFFMINLWNAVYVFAILLFTAGMILRFIPDNESCFNASRIILSIDITLWFFNFLHTYISIKLMGPKLIMIKKMFAELIAFIFIVLAFLIGFGVSTHALNYHNVPASLTLLKNVFFPPFFTIAQELYTKESMLFGKKIILLIS